MASQRVEDFGHPVQIYKFNNNKRELDTTAINSILNEVYDIPVAVVSVNGNKRTGKSFLLNFFLLYLNAKIQTDWFIDAKGKLNGFTWRGGAKRDTVGIWIWSKPFILETEDGRVAVILMDTQGSFDQQTTFKECTLMFCISVWLSSIFIYNIQGQLDEDKLQFLEYFTDFAIRFSNEDIQYSGKLFQNFIFLMRDWPWPDDHPYGLHDHNFPETENFMKAFIVGDEDFSEEAMTTRQQILDYFNHVSCFLLPHPGSGIAGNIDGNIADIDSRFAQYLREFIPSVLGKDRIKPKMFYGEIMTGKKLRDLVDKWATLIRAQEYPEPKTLSEATAEAHLEMALRRAEKRYDSIILGFAKGGMEDSLFEAKHIEITQEVMCQFKETAMKFRKYEQRYGFTKKLEERIDEYFSIYKDMNQAARREAEYKDHFEQLSNERVNIKTSLEKLQRQIKDQQQEMQQQKDISKEEKKKNEETIKKMKEDYERLKYDKKELKRKIKDQEKKFKQENMRKQTALNRRIQIFKPFTSALGQLLDDVVDGFISLAYPRIHSSSPQVVDEGDGNGSDDDSDQNEGDSDDDDGNNKNQNGSDSDSANTSQAINIFASALQSGLDTAAAGGSTRAVVLSGVGNFLQGALNASNQNRN